MGNISHTVGGDSNLVSFRSATRVPITSLKAEFKPKQDFNGYSKPWIGGTGKNLLKNQRKAGSLTVFNSIFTTNEDGSVTITGNPELGSGLIINNSLTLSPGTYILSGCPSNGSESTFKLNLYNDITVNDYGNGATFTLTEETTCKARIFWQAGAALNSTTFYPMIRLASNNDATWEPYENICPIEGWNEVNVWHDKEYIPLPKEYQKIEYIESTGTQYIDTNFLPTINTFWSLEFSHFDINNNIYGGLGGAGKTGSWINVSTNYSYDRSWASFGNNVDIVFTMSSNQLLTWNAGKHISSVSKEGSWMDGKQVATFKNVTFENMIDTLCISARKSNNTIGRYVKMKIYHSEIKDDNILVRNLIPCRRKSDNKPGMYDTVSQTFFTNQGTGEFICGPDVEESISVNWENEVGTVYGGYIDMAKGELIATYKYVILNDISKWEYGLSGTIHYFMYKTQMLDRAGNKFKILCSIALTLNSAATENPWHIQFNKNAGYYPTLMWDSTDYPEISITLEDIKTLAENNKIEICYPLATPITYQLSSIQLQTFLDQNNIWSNTNGNTEVSYAIHDSAMIQSSRKQIIVNEPHIETVNGDIQVGHTATFNTDMISPIKSLKINFKPMQEGYGDASLTNVRNINGWTNVMAGYKKNLPEEYQEVEYIQSNSIYSYIITDYYPNDKTEYYIKIRQGNAATGDYYPTAFSAGELFELYKIGYYVWYQQKGNSLNSSTAYGTNRGLLEISSNGRSWTIINPGERTTTYTVPAYNTFQTVKPLIIMGREVDGEIRDNKVGDPYPKLYRLTLYENNIIVHNYIPCYRKSDNEVGLYDIITNTFLTKSGTGSFVAGPNIEGNIITIDWESEYGTIYGGYVDLSKGELVQTYNKITLDGVTTNCKVNSDYSNDTYIIGGVVYLTPTGTVDYSSGYRSKLFCNNTPLIGAGDQELNTLPFIRTIGNGAQYLRIYVAYTADHPELDTTQKRKDYVNNYLEEHPTTIVYQLKTPIVYQLTPTQLKTLRGTNNIWSNANGPIEVKYWTH